MSDYGPNKLEFKDINTEYVHNSDYEDPVTQPINRNEPVLNYSSGRLKPFKPYNATNIDYQSVPTEHNTELNQAWFYDNYYSYTLKQMQHPDDITYKQYHNRTYITWPTLSIPVNTFKNLQYPNSTNYNYYNRYDHLYF